MTRLMDISEISRMLADRAPALCSALFPDGHREGQEWRIGSLGGEPGQSLGVHLEGRRAGVWSDFASGERGDALDLVAQVLFRGDKGEAVKWARGWLGIDDGTVPERRRRHAPRDDTAEALRIVELRAKKRAAGLALWLHAEADIRGTPVAAYLADARGIDIGRLERRPHALRYHPECWNGEVGHGLPAMVAAVHDAEGFITAHRTWLARDVDGSWGKAVLKAPRKVYGPYGGGSIRLARGAGARPLGRAEKGSSVVITEGIETALTAAMACPDRRVIAAISVAGMATVSLPEAITEVILCAENDTGAQARQGLERAINAHLRAGRRVRIARAAVGSDFNDQLRWVG